MQAMKPLAIASVLFAGTASGQNKGPIREVNREQGYEQLLAASALSAEQLPPSGKLESNDVTLLAQALEPKNNFKFVTWVLCVAPKPDEDGTVLIVDSVQRHARDKGPSTVEVRYRRVKTPGRHTTNQVWPYAVLILRGWQDEVVCRPANG